MELVIQVQILKQFGFHYKLITLEKGMNPSVNDKY